MLVVSKRLMIDKMIDELQLAKEAQDQHKMIQHIASVRFLCEVIVEGESATGGGATHKNTDDISAQELKAMLGQTQTRPTAPISKEASSDDANGDSIFDF